MPPQSGLLQVAQGTVPRAQARGQISRRGSEAGTGIQLRSLLPEQGSASHRGHSWAWGLGVRRTADQECRHCLTSPPHPAPPPGMQSPSSATPTMPGARTAGGRGMGTRLAAPSCREVICGSEALCGEKSPSCAGHTPAISAVPAQIYLLLAHCVLPRENFP